MESTDREQRLKPCPVDLRNPHKPSLPPNDRGSHQNHRNVKVRVRVKEIWLCCESISDTTLWEGYLPFSSEPSRPLASPPLSPSPTAFSRPRSTAAPPPALTAAASPRSSVLSPPRLSALLGLWSLRKSSPRSPRRQRLSRTTSFFTSSRLALSATKSKVKEKKLTADLTKSSC